MALVPGGLGGAEYLFTAFFSAVAAVFGYLGRRAGKANAQTIENDVKPKLATIESQTNGELAGKIKEAVRQAVSHDEIVRAVAEEAIRDYLDGLLMARLQDDVEMPLLNPGAITERRKPDHG